MGLWVFASHLSGTLPYRQLVSIGPLPGPVGMVTRRQEIQHYAAIGRAVPRAPAALYGTLLAAYKQMVAGYQPQYVNDIIVLTAGLENDQRSSRAFHGLGEDEAFAFVTVRGSG